MAFLAFFHRILCMAHYTHQIKQQQANSYWNNINITFDSKQPGNNAQASRPKIISTVIYCNK